MAKTDLSKGEEKEVGPKIIYYSSVTKLTDLSDMVDKYGTIYIAVNGALPLKVTRAELK